MTVTTRLVFLLLAALAFLLAAPSGWTQGRGITLVLGDGSGRRLGLYGDGSYALVIGVSRYTEGWPRLESVPGELAAVERVLRAQGFRLYQDRVILDPTAAEFERAFSGFFKDHGYERDARLLVYFAGHGYTRDEGRKGYLVPADAPLPHRDETGFLRRALTMDDVVAWARKADAKHVLFLFDSCFSGTVFRTRGPPEVPRHIERRVTEPVRQFLTAGSADEPVPAESVFTPAFVRALEERAGDANGDGYVTGSELGAFLYDQVTDHAQQTPQFGRIADYHLAQGDFVFAVGTPTPGPGPDAQTPPPQDPLGVELAHWQATERCGTETCYRDYLARYPRGQFAVLAGERLRGPTAPAAGADGPAEAPVRSASPSPRPGAGPLEPEMVLIRGGRFRMGSPESEEWHESDEQLHMVTVGDFYLAVREVRVAEFRRFVEARGYRTDAERTGEGCYTWTGSRWEQARERSWRDPGFPQGEDHPVACVSWNDALAYAEWLTQASGQRYRLPTEAEWEYAARAGTTTARFWGDDPGEACRYANVADRAARRRYPDWTVHDCDDGQAHTAPVASYAPSPWGLYDMLGNVWEWTCSAYSEAYDGAESRCADPGAGGRRSVRGGAWGDDTPGVRAAERLASSPADLGSYVGFRLARTP